MVFGTVTVLLVGGCRMATRVTEVPRVDLNLEGGNRGYLVGRAPEAPELKRTRQMVETDIEVPSFYRPKRLGAPVRLEELAPPEVEMGEAPFQVFDVYAVQKGDTLWSIAAKPEVYGKATAWRRIFDANRDLLKSPDRLRAGMTLKIPRDHGTGGSTSYGEEGVSYRK
jgi:hypothetical protein